MEVKNVRIAELKEHPRNPRVHPDSALDKLVKSINEFGWTNPVLVSKDGYILAGHARCKAAQKAGLEEVPVIFLDLEGEKADAYLIADNKIQEETDWDIPLLTDLLKDLGENGFDVSLTGFEAAELDELFGNSGTSGSKEVEEDEFDAEEAVNQIEKPISQRGDIFLLGRHRLRCGDSTIDAEVQELMNGQKARLIVTDAPYNVAFNQNGNTNHPSWKKREGILNDNMSTEKFKAFLHEVFTCAIHAAEPGTAIYAFMSAQEWPTIDFTLREVGWHWSSSIIWVKDSLVLGRKDYQPRYEAIWYGWPEGTTRLYPLKEDRTQTDVWLFDRPKRSPLHPTQKPLDLISKPITLSSRSGDIVLDLFGGSGSTLIAADQLGRTAYLHELDEKFVDVIVKRYIEHKGGSDDVYLIRNGEKTAWENVKQA
ncbi:site-specific DNA-methyltransferase [Desulfosporosinus sp. SB140]|uniref:site-specific DNA-methyltransferase n=1 Tax=Desulfosporosinus paludis TaxID=3115649 RepID=UPI00389014F5